MNTVLHHKIYAEVIILVACYPAEARSHTDCLDRICSEEPVGNVDVVNMLLNDMVT